MVSVMRGQLPSVGVRGNEVLQAARAIREEVCGALVQKTEQSGNVTYQVVTGIAAAPGSAVIKAGNGNGGGR
jgi:hypothetical protein